MQAESGVMFGSGNLGGLTAVPYCFCFVAFTIISFSEACLHVLLFLACLHFILVLACPPPYLVYLTRSVSSPGFSRYSITALEGRM